MGGDATTRTTIKARRAKGRAVSDRRRTSTSNFGVSGRESHDASGFYDRFRAPELSEDRTILPATPVTSPFVTGDARDMAQVKDGSVALIITSPPYFAGKQYEEELERDGIPSSYLEYLTMLTDVFRDCVRALEPGGRIAVNVANLGRKPYRSLSADVIHILQSELGLLLRAELIWQKAEGASGSCAWGSYRSASNPVIRDVTERIIIASKGRFDRALSVKEREKQGLPSRSSIGTDDFLATTLDTWSIPPASARRVGHPAPFPVELPRQLIQLYTFIDDLVLDPFMGSGSTLVAAAQLERRFIGYDLDPTYVALARERVEKEGLIIDHHLSDDAASLRGENALIDAGFTIIDSGRKVPGTSVTVDSIAQDSAGGSWYVNVLGEGMQYRGGLSRLEVAFRVLGQVAALRGVLKESDRILILTTQRIDPKSESWAALHAGGAALGFDLIDLSSPSEIARLNEYGVGHQGLLAGFWSEEAIQFTETPAP